MLGICNTFIDCSRVKLPSGDLLKPDEADCDDSSAVRGVQIDAQCPRRQGRGERDVPEMQGENPGAEAGPRGRC